MTVDPDTLVAYALGTLPPEAEAEVNRYLEAHPESREEVRAWQDALALNVFEMDPVPLSDGAERRLLERVRAQHAPRPARSGANAPRPARRVLWPALGLAAALLAALLLLPRLPAYQDFQVQQQVQSYLSRPGAVTRSLQNAEGNSVGQAVRLTNGEVFVALNRAPGSARVYQAWRIPKGQNPVSLGVFPGRVLLTGQRVPEGETFAVSLEPPGGSDQPSSAPIAVVQL